MEIILGDFIFSAAIIAAFGALGGLLLVAVQTIDAVIRLFLDFHDEQKAEVFWFRIDSER